jgi:hypothetical protein
MYTDIIHLYDGRTLHSGRFLGWQSSVEDKLYMELCGAVIDCKTHTLRKNDVKILVHLSKMRFERYSRRYMISIDGFQKDYVVKEVAEFVSGSLIDIIESNRNDNSNYPSVCDVLLKGGCSERFLVVEQVVLRSFASMMQNDFLNIPITLRGCGMVLNEIQAVFEDKTYVVIAMRLVTLFFKNCGGSDEMLELFENTIIVSNDVRGDKMVQTVFQMLETIITTAGSKNYDQQRDTVQRLQKSYDAIVPKTEDSFYDNSITNMLVKILWASWGGKNERISLGMTQRQTDLFVETFVHDTKFIREFCKLNIDVCNGVYERVVCGLVKVLRINEEKELAIARMESTLNGSETIQSSSDEEMETTYSSPKRTSSDSLLEPWDEEMETTSQWD